MARANATRDNKNFMKRGVTVAVIPFVEADVVANSGDGSVVLVLPDRVLVTDVITNITTASGTASAQMDIQINGTDLVNNAAVAAANVTEETVVATQKYQATGGEVVLKPGATAPAAGDLVGEVYIQYIELDRNMLGEYTEMLSA